MRALKKYVVVEHSFVGHDIAWAAPSAGTAATVTRGTKAAAGSHLKNIALFLAAPFVGLAYIIAFPLVGLGALAWLAGKKLLAHKTARPIALAIVAPFATLALVLIAPVAGLGALAWVGGRALFAR